MLPRQLIFVSLFVLALVIHLQANADQDPKAHGHKTPHGGMVQESDGMHAEFLIDKGGEPKLYLYDKAVKPLGGGEMQAKLTVKGHDGAQHSQDLKAVKVPKEGIVYKGDPIKGLKDWDTAVVSLKVKNRWIHFRFSHH